MKLRKGLSYVAFGFLFTLINININYNEEAVLNLMPDFVGWLLFLLAWRSLFPYTEDKPLLQWLPVPMLVYTAVDWYFYLVGTPLELGLLSLIPTAIELVYMFVLFGCLIVLAGDHAPELAPRIRTLRNLNLGIALVFNLVGYLAIAMQNAALAMLLMLGAIVAMGVAVYTCVTLFSLRRSVPE